MSTYATGQIVYVEAVIVTANDNTVTASFPGSTDTTGTVDTIEAVIPRSFVSSLRPEYEAPDLFTREKDQWTDPDDSLDAYYEGAMPWD